jgi:hypothetical protein
MWRGPVRRGLWLVAIVMGATGCGSTSSGDPQSLTRHPPSRYQSICRSQAAYAPRGARACPPLVPSGPVKPEFAGPFSRQSRFGGGYSASFRSPALGVNAHWLYTVTWTRGVRHLAVDVGVEHPQSFAKSDCDYIDVDHQRVERCRVPAFEKGGGLNGGHVAYVWDRRAVTYVISIHGYDHEPLVRAMTQALIAAVDTGPR